MFKLVLPSATLKYVTPLYLIEDSGRICWRSEDKKTDDSQFDFVKRIVKLGHESVLEHSLITVELNTDRGVSHELVRHRIASYSHESTRYVNYSNRELEYIVPIEFKTLIKNISLINSLLQTEPLQYITDVISCTKAEASFLTALYACSKQYKDMVSGGTKPQLARQVLPHALRTTIVVSANFREWRHMFKLRLTNKRAHPHIRALFKLIYDELCINMDKKVIDTLFGDIVNNQTNLKEVCYDYK